MATYTGLTGTLTVKGSVVAQVTRWEVTANVAAIEDTALSELWAGHVGGLASWSGKADCVFDAAVTGQTAIVSSIAQTTPIVAIATVVFTYATSKVFTGNAIITSITVADAVGTEPVTMAVEFVGDGSLVITP